MAMGAGTVAAMVAAMAVVAMAAAAVGAMAVVEVTTKAVAVVAEVATKKPAVAVMAATRKAPAVVLNLSQIRSRSGGRSLLPRLYPPERRTELLTNRATAFGSAHGADQSAI
jgi:hypothetical protein